jgi:hypothetical protein
VDFLDLTQDEDTNSEPEQDDEFVDKVIDLTTGMQETGEEEAGELMGDNEIIDLTGEEEDAGELMGGDDKIIDLTGEEEDTGELMGGDDDMLYFTL